MFQTTNQQVLDSRTPAVDVLGASGPASKRCGALPRTSDGPGDVRRHHVDLKLENTWNCLSWELQCIRTGTNPFVVKLRMAFHWIDHIVHYNTNTHTQTHVYIYIYICIQCVQLYIYICIHAHRYVCNYTHIYSHIWIIYDNSLIQKKPISG